MNVILALVVPEKSPLITFHSLNVFEALSSGCARISTTVPGARFLSLLISVSVCPPILKFTGSGALFAIIVTSNVFTLKPKLFVATGKSAPDACLCAGVSLLPIGLGTT